MAVPFTELAGSPSESIRQGEMRATRRFKIPHAQRWAFVRELMGTAAGSWGGTGKAQYPNFPKMLVSDVKFEPWSDTAPTNQVLSDHESQANSYVWCLCTVEYEQVADQRDSNNDPGDMPETPQGTYLTYDMDHEAEYMMLPGYNNGFIWLNESTAPVPPDLNPTFRVLIIKHVLTYHRVINPPWEAIRNSAGKVNALPFIGSAAKTILFEGAKSTKQFIGVDDFDAPQFGWKVVYTFLEKRATLFKYTSGEGAAPAGELTWNHQWRTLPHSNPGWDILVANGTGDPAYQSIDFLPLFQATILPGQG